MNIAVIVTYFPDLAALSEQLNLLRPQVDRIIIIDNGSNLDLNLLTSATIAPKDLYLLKQDENLGIAEAQNIGIQFAKSLGAEHIIFFDQDSLPGKSMVRTLLAALKKLQSEGVPVAAVAPCYSDSNSRELSGFVRIRGLRFKQLHGTPTTPLVEADFLISSGTLSPMTALDHVGSMDSSLFIDHVDTEWCFRAKKKGYRLYGVCNAVMNHSLGESRQRFWLLRWRAIPHHKPFRYYYIFRNSINLWHRSYMPNQWKLADIVRLTQIFIYFGLLSTQRKENISMMWRGIKDGARNVTGKMPQSKT